MCPDFLFPGIRINSSPYGKYNIICFLFFQVFWNIFPYQRSVNACISSLVTVSFVPPPRYFSKFNCIIRIIPCLFVNFLLKSFNFSVSDYRLCGFLTACADSLVFSLPTFYDKCIHREFLKRSSQEQIPGLYSRPVIACCFDDSPFLLCSASSQTKDFPVYCPLLWPVSSL